MRVAEPFNFTKQLKEIVGPTLKEYGFRMKGTCFIRENGDIEEEIYFQRSQFNLSGQPNQFFLNLDSSNQQSRLDFPTKLIIPSYYLNFVISSLRDRTFDTNKRFEEFTQEQKDEISNYVASRRWTYTTEDELKETFEVAKEMLITRGLSYFNALPNLLRINDELSRLNAIQNFKWELNGWILN